MTRPTVLVYHADPTYAALVRAPRGRVVVRRAATPPEAERLPPPGAVPSRPNTPSHPLLH